MRSPICIFGTCLVSSTLGLVFPAAALTPSLSTQLPQNSLLAQGSVETLLRFETQHYIVRVYEQQGLTFLNVYNKETGFTDQNGVLANVTPSQSEEDPWHTYVNREGDLQYIARVNPTGLTELEIRLSGGPPAQAEAGYNVTYGFPQIYLGEGIDDALADLDELDWVVDSTGVDGVELTRDQWTLALKFDPETRLVTYARLIDRI
ncbi:MAG: hypothetical protein F6J95_022155 [Leptolyngbya sp. SIO1E4]|nr:hypothetical protein [Leptolyngbya sp. SIO1E4]